MLLKLIEVMHRIVIIVFVASQFNWQIFFSRCGSLMFDVVFKFSTVFAEDETFSIIQNAAANGKLGELRVNVSYIIGIPRFPRTTIPAPTSITSKSYGRFEILCDSGSIDLSTCYSLQLLF